MSEELTDEVEAINSIYGAGSLTQSAAEDEPDIYILHLPGGAVSLRLRFSASYPSEPPAVLGTQSSGSTGKRGAASRDLELFRAAVGEVYEPGQVCLFDAIEKVKELLDAARGEVEQDDDEEAHVVVVHHHDHHERGASDAAVLLSDEPPWVMSDPVVELKSTFIARCAAVSSPTQAAQYVQHLLSVDKRVRGATHNITAWRIRGPNGTSFQDCDDDGETAAGGRLLHLMQLMDLWDTMVIVTRWYGGQKLGPRRFALINAAARDAFVKAGLVDETVHKKKRHGK
ncbi:ribosomal protein S5 domain 2-type protein [Podospora didyma]|uniref:Ribosomal protein S5 domain 2-type protein n=1 Tax=Podospora didyma TaxID=330526 RepID=A0AAE0KLR0_9PEZI|nr:ribosomal protein S5 domain 2-type protein [Podospora didyma]